MGVNSDVNRDRDGNSNRKAPTATFPPAWRPSQPELRVQVGQGAGWGGVECREPPLPLTIVADLEDSRADLLC